MILTKDNIQEWKKQLNTEVYGRYQIADFASKSSDEEWLYDWEGKTVEDVIGNAFPY